MTPGAGLALLFAGPAKDIDAANGSPSADDGRCDGWDMVIICLSTVGFASKKFSGVACGRASVGAELAQSTPGRFDAGICAAPGRSGAARVPEPFLRSCGLSVSQRGTACVRTSSRSPSYLRLVGGAMLLTPECLGSVATTREASWNHALYSPSLFPAS